MSLSSHLNSQDSPIRQFFIEQFPNTRALMRECRPQIADANTIRPIELLSSERFPYSMIGTAIDYRMRYYFGITPYSNLVAFRGAADLYGLTPREFMDDCNLLMGVISANDPSSYPPGCQQFRNPPMAKFFTELSRFLDQAHPVGRRLEKEQERQLARYCIVLALLEEIFRVGDQTGSPIFDVVWDVEMIDEILSIAKDHWIDDLCTLSLAFHEEFSHLLTMKPVLNPTFDGSGKIGGADADMILDDCLIDIKSTVKPRLDKLWIYQLLGYVLLDYSDRYQIREVAILMIRQRLLIKWPLQQLLGILMDREPPELSELRAHFREIVASAK